MKVLVACEFSGTVRDAFTRAGHDATSCDLLPSETEGKHHQGDIFDIINQGWDLMVAHPPCTYLTNSGVHHLYLPLTPEDKANGITKKYKPNHERLEMVQEGAEFFNALKDADIPLKAIENPIMHGLAKELTGGGASQFVQPYEYGHPETKRTGLRLIGLPKLVGTENVYEHMLTLPKKISHRVHYLSPGPNRWKERSRFFPGIADAMATQWGSM